MRICHYLNFMGLSLWDNIDVTDLDQNQKKLLNILGLNLML